MGPGAPGARAPHSRRALSQPAVAERQHLRHGSRPPGRGGRTAAATLEDYAPVRKAQAPGEGLRSSGRAPSRQRGLPAGAFLRGGWGPPRVRAPSSRAPVSTTAQGAQLVRCRVRRGCRVFGDRGARRPRDVRRPRGAARWAARRGPSHLSGSAGNATAEGPLFAHRFAQGSPAGPSRAETRARGRALCALGCARRRFACCVCLARSRSNRRSSVAVAPC